MPQRFGADWNPFSTSFISGEWWYDRSQNTFGYPLSEDDREWGDTTWEFLDPEEYAVLATQHMPCWTAKAGEEAMHAALVSGDPYAIDLAANQHPAYRATALTMAYRAMAQRELGDVAAAARTLEDVFGRDTRSDEVMGFARVVESSLAEPST